jgi:hypothetical protein
MSLAVYTVTDADGIVPEDKKGTIVHPLDEPYKFYIVVSSTPTQVQIVMPLGGTESGLFRFPRVGEQVLVQSEGTTTATVYYLMGYVPTGNPFYPSGAAANVDDTTTEPGYTARQKNPGNMDNFLTDYGQAFRYKKTGNTFSEIGFYNKLSKWPVTKGGTDYSQIDTINIQSTGDIESRANNYHLLKAKRFEILANTPEISPQARIDNAKGDAIRNAERTPLGDSFLDKPDIGAGDVHIRADGSIVIKAAKEIRLQVGRTTLVINDKGFTVTSKKVNSSFGTTYDTALGLDSRNGINMTGQNVNVNSVYSFKLTDGWGGAIGSTAGVASISGRQVSSQSIAGPAAICATVVSNVEVAQNIYLGGIATIDQDKATVTKSIFWINMICDWGKKLANYWSLITGWQKIKEGAQKAKQELDRWNADANVIIAANDVQAELQRRYDAANDDDKATIQRQLDGNKSNTGTAYDTAGKIADAAGSIIGTDPLERCFMLLDLLLGITAVIYNAIDMGFAAKDPPQTPKEQSDFRDKLNLCAMSIDNGIIAIVMDSASVLSVTKQGGPSRIAARATGSIVIKAGKLGRLYMSEASTSATLPALGLEQGESVIKYGALAAKFVIDIEKAITAGKQAYEKDLKDPVLSAL